MSQSGPGKIRLFNDFFGVSDVLASTGDPASGGAVALGDFYAGGEGFQDNDAGVAGKDALSGVITLTSGNANAQTTFIGTHIAFDLGLMGPITLETRVQMPDFDTKEIFFGLTSILSVDEQLEDIVINNDSAGIDMPAQLVGFYFSDQLSDDEDWHGIYNATGAAVSDFQTGNVNLGEDMTDDEWQVLRLEIMPTGTVRWYVDGVLKQTTASAASTTTDYAVVLAAAANTTQPTIFDCDYILVEANRDWTV